MNTQEVEIILLSDDELEEVAGGSPNVAAEVYQTGMIAALRTFEKLQPQN